MTEKKNSRFSRWFYGEEDPLLGKVEMKPQKEYKEEELKQVYYFSMEFLLGKLLEDYLLNLGIHDIGT